MKLSKKQKKRLMPKVLLPVPIQVGQIYESNRDGYFEIMKYTNAHKIEVRFLGTGYVTTVQAYKVRNGGIKDKLKPSVSSVGYIGEGEHISNVKGTPTEVYDVWKAMLQRCYCLKTQWKYPTYIGCTVVEEWHNFQTFADWYLANKPKGNKKYQLDKDLRVKGNKLYSPETCKVISAKKNTTIAHAKTYIITKPSGKEVKITNLAKYCRKKNLNKGAMSAVARGKYTQHKGYKCRLADEQKYR